MKTVTVGLAQLEKWLDVLEVERDLYIDFGDGDGAPEHIIDAITVIKEILTQPEQPAQQERNFCQRCGKRVGSNDWDVHTCTPPQPEQHVSNDFDFGADIELAYKEIYAAQNAELAKALAQPEQDCTRSHPHEEMSKECELRTEIARLTNELARLKAKPKEPEHEPVAFPDAPQTIYLQVGDECPEDAKWKELVDVCWCDEQVFDNDIVYVRADTTPPQRKPLLVGKESAEFAEWFNAVWIGDGEQGETIPTEGTEYDEYLRQYTLAFGAWMAAKKAAHGIKE